MRAVDPQWESLQARYGAWIEDGILKYRADEIRRYEAQREATPPTRPAEVEIGSNRGRFLKGLCAGRPQVRFYGVELKRGLCNVAARRLARNGLENGQVIHGDARLVLPVFFGQASLQCVYVLFPDPWWKERHAKRRLLEPEFMRLVHECLEPGGHLVVFTDVAGYARAVHDDLQSLEALYARVTREEVPGHETWVPTTRERHCVEDGLVVHRLYARKR